MICVYSPADTERRGHGIGVLHPVACSITESAGGGYELSMELPLSRANEIAMIRQECVIRAPGAPHRLSAREQDFRVHATGISADGTRLEVRAQHLFYDASHAIVKRVEIREEAPCGEIAAQLMDGLVEKCDLTLDADCTGRASGSWVLCSMVNALLDPEAGLVRQGHLRLERDRAVIRLRDGGGEDSGVVLRYGGSLARLGTSQSIQGVVTRLYPVGEAADGSDLLLPERYIDAPEAGRYAAPRIAAWKVTGARVGQRTRREDGSTQALTEDEVFTLLREAAAEKIRAGCDRAQDTVSFVHVQRPVALQGEAESICLYDRIRLRHDAARTDMDTWVTGYTWDVLKGRYESLEAGDPWKDRSADLLATSPQLRRATASAKRRFEDYGELLLVTAEDILLQGQHIALLASDCEDLDRRTGAAELVLDGMRARIDLMATKVELGEQEKRLSQAEIELDGLNAELELKASRTEMDALGTRVSNAEIELDGLNAELELKAGRTEMDALGTRVSNAEILLNGAEGSVGLVGRVTDAEGKLSQARLDIDGAKSQIALKANRIDLQGYVTLDQFEAVEGWTESFTGHSISADFVTCGKGDFDDLVFGTLAGENCGWESDSCLTSAELTVTKQTINFVKPNGDVAAVTVVTSATLNTGSKNIKYLGQS